LAQSYEFVETSSVFCSAPATIRLRKRHKMIQLAIVKTKRRSRPTCDRCGVAMRLFGIESHPTIDRHDLRTYVCSHCDEVKTELVPAKDRSRAHNGRTAAALDMLLARGAFDAETTHLLGSTFDTVWETVKASDAPLADEHQARELLAKYIVAMAEQGERNPDRLVASALRRLARSNSPR
jgi:hypothetical protein